ncbi:uncharacterized protein N7479_008200 [Penicillium vulpinum]|uniref:Prenylated rab acceptor 1 n=1 Tax=Penicillium vulpinum TaxID=29845 RepID=A0A1V6RK41_9EURO|nr:uncharacterized protein N7479_008200 [Penicillium vulpinum]KAJ5961050.1 hypothetical protein N7479_008200 [Penicillium vulpinum]OQE01733.1 hypothetical protein PENVUL_c041G04238 [Penicillium vulpinum]
MPPWGRPPGARTGRNNRGRGVWEETRLEEVDSEEDAYGRELVRSGRHRQMEYGGRGPRRRPADYEDLMDEPELVDGGDFDLYDYEDSTVAYAIQLAMRDKEDQLVDTALERIRRAQALGRKNVRLSKQELDALERKRQQTDSSSGSRRPSTGSVKVTSRPSSRRSAVVGTPEHLPGAYSAFAPDGLGNWARGTAGSRPSSSSSARPRTPTTQSLRPQQSSSPLRPTYPTYTPERFAPNVRPQSMQQPPTFQRPLPDDPQWVPPYYNPMQMSPHGEPPYQPQVPTDLRAGQQSRMSYPSGPPYPIYESPGKRPQGTPQVRGDLAASVKLGLEKSSEDEPESSEDEVQVVKVGKVERMVPVAVTQKRPVAGTTRKRTSRCS